MTLRSPAYGPPASGSTFYAANGTVTVPSYSFASDTDTGFYLNPANGVAYTFGGANVFSMLADRIKLRSNALLTWSSTTDAFGSTDLALVRDAANVLAQRNAGNAQAKRVYNTFTDTSNFEYAGITWTSNQVNINVVVAGTGTQRNIGIATNAGRVFVGAPTDDATSKLQVAGNVRSEGVLLSADGSIAAPGHAFKDELSTGMYRASSGVIRITCAGTDAFSLSTGGFIQHATSALRWGSSGISTPDLFLLRDTGNTVAQRNGTAAQVSRIYNTFTDASNYERVTTRFLSGVPIIEAQAAGTGTQRPLSLNPNHAVLVGSTSQDSSNAGNVLQVTFGHVAIKSVGAGIAIAEGSNAKMGASTLVAGTVTVNNTAVGANSRIMLSGQNASGTAGELTISARVAGTSFTITSTSGADTRSVAWLIFDPDVP